MLVGGPAVLDSNVEAHLAQLVPSAQVVRLAGPDRYTTSAAVVAAVTGRADSDDAAVRVLLASGVHFADALAGIPVAARWSSPLALTTPDCMPVSVADELSRLPLTTLVKLGGTGALGTDAASACVTGP